MVAIRPDVRRKAGVLCQDPGGPRPADAPAAPDIRTDDILVAGITVREITRKASPGKLPMFWAGYRSFSMLSRAQGFPVVPLGWKAAEAANALPDLHKDPMDRMLVATAMRHDLEVLTEDAIFGAYGVTTVW